MGIVVDDITGMQGRDLSTAGITEAVMIDRWRDKVEVMMCDDIFILYVHFIIHAYTQAST